MEKVQVHPFPLWLCSGLLLDAKHGTCRLLSASATACPARYLQRLRSACMRPENEELRPLGVTHEGRMQKSAQGARIMGIAQKVARNFSEAVRSRGQAYFTKGRVTVMSARPNEMTARVRGTTKYRVRVRLRGSKLLASCTCPYFSCAGR